MSAHYCNMPMVTCPHCDRGFQWDDYYDVEVGDGRECPHCNKTIYVENVDTVIEVRLSTEEPA